LAEELKWVMVGHMLYFLQYLLLPAYTDDNCNLSLASEKFDKLNDDSRLMQERLSKQSESAKSEATVEVVQQMLNVIDTYERAFNSVDPSTPEQEAIVAEYRATYDKILECFDELNVTKIKTVGAEFDYEMHQAMMQMPNDEFEAGVVCQEFAPGWVVGDKLVRPAMVAVAC
jgi:molecular chaperone GrpE